MNTPATYAVVIPTIGRPSLADCLAALERAPGPAPAQIVVVDDRPGDGSPLRVPGVTVVRSGGRGPAAARNAGWRATSAPWVVFLDDDVQVTPAWRRDLARDLERA